MYRRGLRDDSIDPLLIEMASVNARFFNPTILGDDGEKFVYPVIREQRTDLFLGSTNGRKQLTMGSVVPGAFDKSSIDTPWFDWSPQTNQVSYISENSGTADVWTVNTETGEKTRITTHPEPDESPRLGPCGATIAFTTDHRSPGAPALVTEDGRTIQILREDEYQYGDLQWVDDETLLAIRSQHKNLFEFQTELVRLDSAGNVDIVLSESETLFQAPRPQPGANAFAFINDSTGYDALYLRTESGDVKQLFSEKGAEIGAPAWNAAGDALAITVTRDGIADIWVVPIDGEARRLTNSNASHCFPTWNGSQVIAMRTTPTRPYEPVDVEADNSIGGEEMLGLEERLVDPEHLVYDSSDGQEVHAMVYLPQGVDDADPGSVPLIVNPHGGPTAHDGFEFDLRPQYFAALGYAVIQPNYRGSSGFGRDFRNKNDYSWGEGDLRDVVQAADALADESTAIDGDRAGIFGGSGGGLMTVNALGRFDRFDVGAAYYGVYDYETFIDDTDDIGWRLLKRELGFPSTDIENYRDTSPIRWATDIDVPILLLHGEDDVRVPISQSEQLAAKLEEEGKMYEFQRYDGEGHGFRRVENIVNSRRRVADLFAKYLQVDPDDGSSRPHPSS